MKTKYKVLSVELLAGSTYRLRVERRDFVFRAGQCVNIGTRALGINREYSIYSGEEEPYVDFLIREVKGGIISVALKNLRPTDEVELDGPFGEFCLPRAVHNGRYLFVGSGTGIAPFHSFVKSNRNLDYLVLHGIRHGDEAYHREDYEKKRYVACVSRDGKGDFQGRVTDYLRRSPPAKGTLCFLCGNRAMINETYDILRESGIPGSDIFTETFF